MSTPVEVPPDLKQRYREGRLVPFVGAGASMDVSWTDPDGTCRRGISWSELVDYAARKLGFEDPDLLRVRGTDLQILEYYRHKRGGELAPLHNWFAQSFHAPDSALIASPIHNALARLTLCDTYYTTNYDDYLERSLSLLERNAAAVAVEFDLAQLLKRQVTANTSITQVVKFHGDLNNPSRMVLSESDYEHRTTLTAIEDRRLISDLIGRAVLFIGYSFRDYNVSYLFRLINDQLGDLPDAPSGNRAYITVPDPSDFEYTLFRARNMKVIPVRSTHMSEDVADLLRRLP